METRHPVEGDLGNEFPSICNHSGVMASWSRKTSNFFAFFLKNDPLRENYQNFVPKGFLATLIDVLCSNFVKLGWRKSVKSCTWWVIESESNIQLKPSFEPNIIIVNPQCLSLFDTKSGILHVIIHRHIHMCMTHYSTGKLTLRLSCGSYKGNFPTLKIGPSSRRTI